MNKTIIVNIKKCLACKSCELACALEHSKSKQLQEAITESPKPQRMVGVDKVDDLAVPIQCRHCQDAPCIEICPTGAIHRQTDQSPVVIDDQLCIGCKLCVLICPYGVLEIDRQARAIIKCDMCYQRAKDGKLPRCVQACPTNALKFASPDQTKDQKRTPTKNRRENNK